jgi:hypothetical protein
VAGKLPVGTVEAPIGEILVEHGLDRKGVVREEQRVDVEAEGDGCVAELVDAVHRFQPAGHSDLDDVGAEGSDVADDIDVAGLDVGGAVIDVLDRPVDVGELGTHALGTVGVAVGDEGSEHVRVVGAFLLESFLLACQFLLRLLLLAELLAAFTLELFLDL